MLWDRKKKWRETRDLGSKDVLGKVKDEMRETQQPRENRLKLRRGLKMTSLKTLLIDGNVMQGRHIYSKD